jgi:hypothetical protein
MRPPALRPSGACAAITIAVAAGALAASLGACGGSSRERGAPIGQIGTGGGGEGGGFLFDAGTGGPPPLDAGGLCGNQLHELIADPPNVYFVLDTSGSMTSNAGDGYSRYHHLRTAATGLVTRLGALINVGAARFPFADPDDLASQCDAGGEILSLRPGDPSGKGPTTSAFAAAIDVHPFGGTPTAATLRALAPTLTTLVGRTIVVLATDGGPNCNSAATCSADECMINLEGCDPSVTCCKPGGNCCTADVEGGPENCIDRQDSVDAVAALEAGGVPVYVVGIPGSEPYAKVLSDMALAGGAPLLAPPFYYAVQDLGTLEAVLGSIAAVAISCDFPLVDPPPVPDYTNVYLDQDLVLQDWENGWAWKDVTTVELRGEACEKLKSGQVKQVQIVSGCPTEAAK